MSIETTLLAALRADASVQAYVSSGSPLVHRIYPAPADPKVSPPYITYQVITGQAHNKLLGAPGSERKLLQFNCVANSYADAKGVAEAIKTALGTSYGWMMGESDDYFPDVQNYRVRLDWSYIGPRPVTANPEFNATLSVGSQFSSVYGYATSPSTFGGLSPTAWADFPQNAGATVAGVYAQAAQGYVFVTHASGTAIDTGYLLDVYVDDALVVTLEVATGLSSANQTVFEDATSALYDVLQPEDGNDVALRLVARQT